DSLTDRRIIEQIGADLRATVEARLAPGLAAIEPGEAQHLVGLAVDRQQAVELAVAVAVQIDQRVADRRRPAAVLAIGTRQPGATKRDQLGGERPLPV